MILLSIDPGVKALGWALWLDGSLARAGISTTKERALDRAIRDHRLAVPVADTTALEEMRWRPGDARSQPNDLLAVQAVGIGVSSHPITLYPASRWKGPIPKRVHHDRIRKVLGQVELAILGEAAQGAHAKEVLDAVGIGLYHLGRTNRSGGQRQ